MLTSENMLRTPAATHNEAGCAWHGLKARRLGRQVATHRQLSSGGEGGAGTRCVKQAGYVVWMCTSGGERRAPGVAAWARAARTRRDAQHERHVGGDAELDALVEHAVLLQWRVEWLANVVDCKRHRLKQGKKGEDGEGVVRKGWESKGRMQAGGQGRQGNKVPAAGWLCITACTTRWRNPSGWHNTAQSHTDPSQNTLARQAL